MEIEPLQKARAGATFNIHCPRYDNMRPGHNCGGAKLLGKNIHDREICELPQKDSGREVDADQMRLLHDQASSFEEDSRIHGRDPRG